MRILLVNMPTPPQVSFGRSTQPLGLAYLASTCESAGVEVDIFEGNRNAAGVDDLVDACCVRDFDVIGFSATTPSFSSVDSVARIYRERGGRALLVAGGHHVSAIGGCRALEEAPHLDVAVVGEGEESFLDVITRRRDREDWSSVAGTAARYGDTVRDNGGRHLIKDLDALPRPARHLLPALENYAGVRRWPKLDIVECATIAASRGCPYRCSFCDIQMFYRREDGPMRRVRSPEQVVEEMCDVRGTRDDLHFAFMDDLFPYSPNWVRRFTAALIEAGRPGTFSFAGRADQIVRNPALLSDLVRAGCSSIEMGIESGSQTVLDRYRKDLTVGTNLAAIQSVQDSGIRTIVDFIMFDPWTTLTELAESVDFLKRARSDAGFPTAVYTRLSFYPGTPLFDQWMSDGPVEEDDPAWFAVPEVYEVWTALNNFRRTCQKDINTEVDAWRSIHREAHERGSADLRAIAVDNMYTARRLPYRVLEQLVGAAMEGGLRDAQSRIVRGARDVVDRIQSQRHGFSRRVAAAGVLSAADPLLSE